LTYINQLIFVMDLVGTVAFAAAGAMVAIKRNADLFGVLLCGLLTAQGGGAMRDLILGNHPPRMFQNTTDLWVALATATVVFWAVRLLREKVMDQEKTFDAVLNIMDALGLAVFTVNGMNVALEFGGWDNGVLTVTMGMMTGIGGGILRDVILARMPTVLRKQFYATASLIGGLLYWVFLTGGLRNVPSILISMLTIFVLRMLATRYRWNLPKALVSKNK